MKKKDPQSHFERCVLCGVLTDVLVTVPVEFRQNYADGIGQLCEPCHCRLERNKG